MSYQTMVRRFNYYGGADQQQRMIKDKLWSMLSTIKHSYQSARFTKYPEMNNTVSGLFNPDKQTMSSDTKLISVEFDKGYEPGTIFKWENTQTFWLCYVQEKEELAYFRGLCRRCDYKVKWVNGERQVLETYLAVIGPTQIDFRTIPLSNGFTSDYSAADLTVMTSNNEQNIKYFNQYQKFVLHGKTYAIHQVDTLSMPGVIKMNCIQEDNNLIEDDVENDLKNRWNIQPIIPQYNTQYGIEGPTVIKPLFPYKFTAIVKGGMWYIEENTGNTSEKHMLPIKWEQNDLYQQSVVLTWDSGSSGAFTLCYVKDDGKVLYKRHILVESLL